MVGVGTAVAGLGVGVGAMRRGVAVGVGVLVAPPLKVPAGVGVRGTLFWTPRTCD